MKRLFLFIAFILILSLVTCERQARRVSYNVSKAADNFDVLRRLSVLDLRNGVPIFELIGYFSINVDNTDKQLEIICMTSQGEFTKHFVDIRSPWTMYVIEGIDPNQVDSFRYEMNFYPEMIVPFTTKKEDRDNVISGNWKFHY